MVYIWQHICPEKLQGYVFIQISLILTAESVSNELLAIIKMKNIMKIVKLNMKKMT